MGRRVPGDLETNPRDAVKVTGWAIRCTILRNTSERHLRRSLITFENEAGSPRDGDSDEIAKTGETVMTRASENSWTGATTKRPSQFPSLLHTIQIVCRGTKSRRFFTIPGPPFNFSPTNTRTEVSRRIWDSRRIDFFRFPNRPGRDDYSLRSRRATRDRRDPRAREFIRLKRRTSIDALITRKIYLANTQSRRTANDALYGPTFPTVPRSYEEIMKSTLSAKLRRRTGPQTAMRKRIPLILTLCSTKSPTTPLTSLLS